MTEAVCFKCGVLKWGAFNLCKNCGARPTSDDDLMVSLACTDHYFERSKLEEIGQAIKAGHAPELDPATREKLIPEIGEAKRLMGLDRTPKRRNRSATSYSTSDSGRLRIGSPILPAARIGRLRQWKIALSLAVVGALAAPFVFRTYKARPEIDGFRPLVAERQKDVTAYLEEHNYCHDPQNAPKIELCSYSRSPSCVTLDQYVRQKEECSYQLGLLQRGEYYSYFDSRKFFTLNLMALIGGFVGVFGLAYLIPMLIRGVAFLARRYCRWLNA
jgi:hypothetical protein